MRVGDSGVAATITTNGAGNLTLSTNAGTNSGTIVINQGANGDIALTPNGTGEVDITKVNIDGGTIDGTAIGGASASTGAFTTLAASSTVTLSGGTANGVLYLNGSKVATSGSALTFDGTNFATTGTATATKLIPTGNVTAGNGMFLPTTNELAWSVNGSEGMRLTSTGLGIGTSSPVGRLRVKASAATFASGLSIQRFDTADTYEWVIGSDNALYLGYATSASGADAAGDFTSRLVLDSSGNLGLGVTPSAWFANSRAIDIGAGGAVQGRSNDATTFELATNAYLDSAGTWRYKSTNRAGLLGLSAGTYAFNIAASGTAGNAISFTQAMTLDASGNLLVGTTSSSPSSSVGIKNIFSSSVPQVAVVVNQAGASAGFSLYNVNASAYRFYADNAGTIFATNTTISAISDQRFKENVQDLDVGLNAIMALKPRKFDWKANKGKDIKGDHGFIAQEFEQVFPGLVDEWKDPAPEGEVPYKSVRQDLIPVLVKAIQEQQALIESLTSRVSQLEGA